LKLTQKPVLRQTLTLAPQMIQSLNMLTVPILKLEQMLRHELAINPMLEETSPTEDNETELSSAGEDSEAESDPALNKIDWETYFGEDHEVNKPYMRGSFEKAEEINDQSPAPEKNLYEHLNEQLSYAQLSESQKVIGQYIIGNLDECGFLTCSISDIAEALSVGELRVWQVLTVIQGFDPSGVGARNLRESLLIQLNQNEMVGTLPYLIVSLYFDRLDKLSHGQLARLLKVPQERIERAFEEIRQLGPGPALGRFSIPATAIIPDLIVERIDDEFIIIYNDKNVPRLRVSMAYKDILKKTQKPDDDTQKYVKEKLDQARWILSAINQRRLTMIRVMEAIVKRQKEFFEYGTSHLRPLRMQDIADEVEMDVSTICRVANDKYVQTPMGVYEIKYFFNSGVSTDDGEELTKRNVKQIISKIITDENPGDPLPDQKIKEMLAKEGVQIARRTVSKYREELKIMPARFRKRTDKGIRDKAQNNENSGSIEEISLKPIETVS